MFDFTGNLLRYREARAERSASAGRLNVIPQYKRFRRRDLRNKMARLTAERRKAILKVFGGGMAIALLTAAVAGLVINTIRESETEQAATASISDTSTPPIAVDPANVD